MENDNFSKSLKLFQLMNEVVAQQKLLLDILDFARKSEPNNELLDGFLRNKIRFLELEQESIQKALDEVGVES